MSVDADLCDGSLDLSEDVFCQRPGEVYAMDLCCKGGMEGLDGEWHVAQISLDFSANKATDNSLQAILVSASERVGAKFKPDNRATCLGSGMSYLVYLESTAFELLLLRSIPHFYSSIRKADSVSNTFISPPHELFI